MNQRTLLSSDPDDSASAPTADRTCLKSLTKAPLPLYSDALDIAVLWNAKAGCTFAIKWLYFQEGLLDEALLYSTWPHEYRQQVYCRRPAYSDKVRRIPSMGPRAIKFVRNPYDRVVSGYLAFCHQAHHQTSETMLPITEEPWELRRIMRDPKGASGSFLRARVPRIYGWLRPAHTSVLTAMEKHLGRSVRGAQGFTFREFVQVLGGLDLDGADPHIRRQVSVCEQRGQLPGLTIVRIEESAEVLPAIETELGLPHADLGRLRESGHHTERVDVAGFVGDQAFGTTLGVPVPRSGSFYDDAIATEIARIYREDLDAYGYSLNG